MNIVVVEDNDDLRETVVELLQAQGHRVQGLRCAEDLGDEGGRTTIDLLLVDLNLPGEDGLSLALRMRRAQPSLRILMMTARHLITDKVRGYASGADIYLTKPINLEELTAAVMALARQLNPAQASTGPRLEVLTFSLRALGPNGAVALNASELMVLRALVRSPDQRLAHWQLLEIMALSATDANQAKLAVRMSRLRKKLDSLGFSGPTLQVIRQEGYQLCLPVQLL